MSINAATDTKEKKSRSKTNRNRFNDAQNVTSDDHFYRIIVGVHDNFGDIRYICYRKDLHHNFVLANINFNNDDQLEDTRYIFDTNDFKNLLIHLAQYNNKNLVMIAKIGRKEIDHGSLLPII